MVLIAIVRAKLEDIKWRYWPERQKNIYKGLTDKVLEAAFDWCKHFDLIYVIVEAFVFGVFDEGYLV